MKTKLLALILFLLIGLSSLTAVASPIFYPDPVTPPGATKYTYISENSVTDPPPLFGAPIQIGSTLSFAPTTFASYSGPNSSDLTSGTLKFDASAPLGEHFTTLLLNEVGDFAVTGLGNSQAYVSGLITVRDLDSGQVLFNSLAVSPPSPFLHPPSNDGPFQASTNLVFPDTDIRNIEVVFNNTLATSADPLSAALVQKKSIDITITDAGLAPEPVTMLLLGLGAIGVVARRRPQLGSA